MRHDAKTSLVKRAYNQISFELIELSACSLIVAPASISLRRSDDRRVNDVNNVPANQMLHDKTDEHKR